MSTFKCVINIFEISYSLAFVPFHSCTHFSLSLQMLTIVLCIVILQFCLISRLYAILLLLHSCIPLHFYSTTACHFTLTLKLPAISLLHLSCLPFYLNSKAACHFSFLSGCFDLCLSRKKIYIPAKYTCGSPVK